MMASVAAINSLGGHAHNPRGNLWFNDESTYGHKLLMKMGWNKGRGLGKNEDGIKENLKVKFRNTNSGLGFKDDAYANVMKSEYESILKNLATEYSCPGTNNLNKAFDNTDDEPVQKSKVVKSKLRYPKLFFGKDVTKYSEKDMKSIFICSSTPLKSIEGESRNSVTFDKKDSESESPQEFGTYSSSLSISDYFAKKMEAKKRNMLNQISNSTVVSEQTSLESENTDPTTLTLNNNATSKRKQKNPQVDIERDFNDVEQNEVSTEIEDLGALAMSNKKSSKKRKKKHEMSIKDTELNSNENLSYISNFTKEEVLENSLEETISFSSNIHTVENNIKENSRANKKRKLSQAFENNLAESSQSTSPSETKSSLSPTKKKRKKCKTNSATIKLPSENPACESNISAEIDVETNNFSLEPELSNNTECSKKRKKSKKKLKEKLKSCLKNKHGSYSLKNISFNETVSYRIIDSETESVEPLVYSENLGTNNTSIDCDKNNLNDDANLEDETTSNEINSDDNKSCANEQDDILEKSDEQWKLSDLPSSKSPFYNAWVESQRQALKMKLYKSMFKSIKKHKILKTTNLLSIKGYGNWGF